MRGGRYLATSYSSIHWWLCRGLCFNHNHASKACPKKTRKKRKIRVEQRGRKRIRSFKTILGTDIKRKFGSMSRSVYARKRAEWPDKKSNVSKMQYRHPPKGCCNDRQRAEMKRCREKMQRKVLGGWSFFVQESMSNNRSEDKQNEQRPGDLSMQLSLKASVMKGLRCCILRHKKVFLVTTQH